MAHVLKAIGRDQIVCHCTCKITTDIAMLQLHYKQNRLQRQM